MNYYQQSNIDTKVINFLITASAVFVGAFLAISLTGARGANVGASDNSQATVSNEHSSAAQTVAAGVCTPASEDEGASVSNGLLSGSTADHGPVSFLKPGHHVNKSTTTNNTTNNTSNDANNSSNTSQNNNSGIGVQDLVDVSTGDILSNNETNVLNDSLNNNSVLSDNKVLNDNLNDSLNGNAVQTGIISQIL
jgi:hypothetical protein